MRIGIIETGLVSEDLLPEHGPYGPMFERLLRAGGLEPATFTVSVVRGEALGAPQDADGWIVTGSRHGAYEDHAWIPPLEAFIRETIEDGVPLVGVCFGHQIIAQAMGGRVVKSDRGWGIGVQDYEARATPGWMAGFADGFAARAVHQDQVVEVPEGATVLAGNAFCPVAALAYGDPEAPRAISVQPHPEFDAGFVRGIIDTRRGTAIPDDRADAALATLHRDVDNDAWAGWIVEFFRRRAADRSRAA